MSLGCCCNEKPFSNPLLARLCAEHDRLLDLVKQILERTSSSAAIDRVLALGLAAKLRELLRSHHELEEAKFLPWIGRLAWASDAIELVGEHRQGEDLVDTIVGALRRGDMASAASSARQLQAALQGHVQHEGRIFKRLDEGEAS